MKIIKSYFKFLFLIVLFVFPILVGAQTINPSLFNCMKWRMIGPYRGGRTVGACGDLQHPNVFYIGVSNGGVWKTTDFGRTWNPIFDDQPTGSIGDVCVAPSNPNTIYVGSGEGIQRPDLSVGDGMYKSVDAGKTWQHIGLQDGLQIGGLAIDPNDENRVFVAILGHPYGANKERGVYRTLDGGKTWVQVLYLDENTGAIQVLINPKKPNVVYADLFASRLAPWENGEWAGKGSGLYKSVDGGNTWKQLINGLPGIDSGLGRIGVCIAPSNPERMYAVVSANQNNGGIYRSDNGGESWLKLNSDPRLWDRGDDFAELKVDPKNENIIYDANVVVWKSTDAGNTWAGFKGAPGGDDYHRLWINEQNTDIILCANDQGGIVTVNGGTTWSSWYNQPTAQLYHVSADNAFPYNVYSGQQESGSVGIASRGNDGAITFRDWHPVGAEEYGYVVADPLDPNIIYGGKITRYDKRTGQSQNISPEAIHTGKYRFIRTAPILFSPIDNKTLYYAGNVIFKTRDGGTTWQTISPDLTRVAYYDLPDCIGVYKKDEMKTMPRRGVIYTLALSTLDSDLIWAGTDDGLIWNTIDGGIHWELIPPKALSSWSKVSIIEASHTNKSTAFAAINRIRLDDLKPHIYRTKDFGTTWQEIVKGLPNEPINVVKEDPQCKGLLFAGTERAVYVSFDDGDNWQTLRGNMPATSVRDLVIKDNDLIVATHGRSFWILDDITPLRQLVVIKQIPEVILYKPQTAIRVRWNMNTDTPLPPDEPVGKNPPDGAIIDYYLAEDAKTEVTLDVIDLNKNVIRHYSSLDTLYKIPNVNIPLYWIRPQQILSAEKGAHRFLWDMCYAPLNIPIGYSMSAILMDTPPEQTSPWVMPGNYTIKLTVNGKVYTQPLSINIDPRVKTTINELQKQHDLSYLCYKDEDKILLASKTLPPIIDKLKKLENKANTKNLKIIDDLLKRANSFFSAQPISDTENFTTLFNKLHALMHILQGADVAPTTQCKSEVIEYHKVFERLWKNYELLLSDVATYMPKRKG